MTFIKPTLMATHYPRRASGISARFRIARRSPRSGCNRAVAIALEQSVNRAWPNSDCQNPSRSNPDPKFQVAGTRTFFATASSSRLQLKIGISEIKISQPVSAVSWLVTDLPRYRDSSSVVNATAWFSLLRCLIGQVLPRFTSKS